MLHRLYDRSCIGNFLFKCADRFPEQGERPLLVLREISAHFVSLRIASWWSTDWTQDGAAKRGQGGRVKCRGLIVPQVCRRAVPKCRRQGFVDGRFKLNDCRGALARFQGVECLKSSDALLQPLDATPLLSDGQDRRFGLGRGDGTTGHGIPRIKSSQRTMPRPTYNGRAEVAPCLSWYA